MTITPGGREELLARLRLACAGRYEIERTLGQGGTAVVYLARDLKHPRQVAIKVLDPSLAALAGTDRFRREIEIAARLNHPHILSLIDSGEVRWGDAQVPYYVMPFVAGNTLRDRLSERGALPLEEALRITTQVADALGYAHREGVVHRDIKPENILFQNEHAIVADFGVSRAIDEAGERMTLTGFSPGTPHYMAPEQLAGESDVDGQADLYALGCITFEMLAGKRAFVGSSLQSMLTRRLTEDPPTLARAGIPVPPQIEAAVAKAMARERQDRFATAAEFVAALTRPSGRRLRWIEVACLAVVVIAVLVVLVRWLRPDPGRSAGRLERTSRLAIRPLVDSGRDSSAAYLSEGIHEGVADLLRQVPGLSLTAPTLVAEVLSRNPSLDLRALARNLGVDAILTWNMRRLGDSLHVRAELVSGGDGRIVWGSSYDRAMTDLPRLESEIARALVDTLGVARSNLARAGMERRRNVDPGAYDAYLRGYHVWLTATPLGARGAREKADSIGLYARRALTLDSTFTGGYILLGAYYSVSAIRGWRTPLATVLDSARTILEKALSRDSAMADPWILLGLLDFYSTDEFARAGARLRRGVSLNPDLVTGQQFYGIYLAEVERQLDSAAAHFEQAIKRDPQNQLFNSLGDIMMRARRYDSAVVLLRHGIAVDSVPPGPHNRLIQSLEALQDYPAAIEARRRAPDSTGAGRFAAAFAKSGASGYLRERAAELRRRADAITAAPLPEHGTVADSIPPLRENRLALLYLQLGEPAKAMDWIEREYQRRPRRFRLYYAHPDFDQLHQDPRFQALARKEGLLE